MRIAYNSAENMPIKLSCYWMLKLPPPDSIQAAEQSESSDGHLESIC